MNPRNAIANEHTSTLVLDTHLNGIREEFDRLNKELDDTRKQRDEYKANWIKAKELRKLEQIVSHRVPDGDCMVCQHCEGEIAHTTGNNPLLSRASPSSEYYSDLEGEAAIFDRPHTREIDRETEERATTTSDITSVSVESNVTPLDLKPSWRVEFNSDAKTALNLAPLRDFTQEPKGSTYVSFSRDGKLLATLSVNGVVRIFDVKTGKTISIMRDLYEPDSKVTYSCVGLSPDSKYLATGSQDGHVRVWIISKRRLRNIFRHDMAVYDLNFSPTRQSVVTCSFDGTVRVWRLRDGHYQVFTSLQYPFAAQFSPDGRYIASGDFSGPIVIWNVRRGNLVAKCHDIHDVSAKKTLVFTPDGKGLLSVAWNKVVISSLARTTQSDADDCETADRTKSSRITEISRLVGHTDRVRTISISPDGKWIASGSRDMTVRIWRAHDSTLHSILHSNGIICSVDFSQVGNYLAIGNRTGQVGIWSYADL